MQLTIFNQQNPGLKPIEELVLNLDNEKIPALVSCDERSFLNMLRMFQLLHRVPDGLNREALASTFHLS